MLKEFTVSNYKSINKELTFSMEADCERVSEYPEHVLDINNSKILKVASMYGPNGGGKTNILSAIELLKLLVMNNNFEEKSLERSISCEFCNNDIINESFFFMTNNCEIGYKFSAKYKTRNETIMDFTGRRNERIIGNLYIYNEELIYKYEDENDFTTLYERDREGKIKSEILDSLNFKYSKQINETLTFLSYFRNTFVNNNNFSSKEMNVFYSLYQEITNIYLLEVIGNINYDVAFNAISNNKVKLIELMNNVDIRISDIILNKKNKNNPILFERIVNVDGESKKKTLPLYDESRGTKKVFWMFVNLLNENNKSHLFLCDDMNAYLHPKLYKEIIRLFNSQENKDKQLIFNSHDIINMTNEVFRRDEIWFVYRDDDYSTQAVPLSNIVNYKGEQVRKDAKYYKQYLEGRYGADPFIVKGLSWYE